MSLMIDQIRRDGGTQARAGLNPDTVADYAEQMEDETTVFPPVIVYHDGKDYWLADGFHRVAAWERIGRQEIPAEVRQGDRRRAILHACAANAAHGLRRTADDKRRAVMTLLEDEEWSQWSDREIARRCVVSAPFVGRLRKEVTVNVYSEDAPRTYTTKHGTTAKMDTSKIGASKTETSAPLPAEALSEERGAALTRPAQGGGGDLGAAPVKDAKPDEVLASDADGQEDGAASAAPADPHAKLRAEFRALTAEAQEDDWVNVRLSLLDEKAARKKAEREAEQLRRQVTELTDATDSATVIRNQAKEIKRLNDKVWKANEDARKAIAARRRAEDRVRALEGAGVQI